MASLDQFYSLFCLFNIKPIHKLNNYRGSAINSFVFRIDWVVIHPNVHIPPIIPQFIRTNSVATPPISLLRAAPRWTRAPATCRQHRLNPAGLTPALGRVDLIKRRARATRSSPYHCNWFATDLQRHPNRSVCKRKSDLGLTARGYILEGI